MISLHRSIYCERLKRMVLISKVAIPNNKKGWVCDCGRWTKEDPDFHDVND